jgi:hypothetical protein
MAKIVAFQGPLRRHDGFRHMERPLRTGQECFGEAKKLIAEAVAEPDDTRRAALLVMADHWVALQAARGERPPLQTH